MAKRSGFQSLMQGISESLESGFDPAGVENRKQREHDAAQKEAQRVIDSERTQSFIERARISAQATRDKALADAETEQEKKISLLEKEGELRTQGDSIVDPDQADKFNAKVDSLFPVESPAGAGQLPGLTSEQDAGIAQSQVRELFPSGGTGGLGGGFGGAAPTDFRQSLQGPNPISAAMEPQGPPAAMMQKMLQVPMESLGLGTMESQANFNAVQKKIPNIKELMLDPNVARDVVSAVLAIGSTQGDHDVTLDDVIKILKEELPGGRFRGAGATGSF